MLTISDHTTRDRAAIAAVLDALCRRRLIDNWRRADRTSFEVVVGRGTVASLVLDAPGVLRMATVLRRDQVRVLSDGYPFGYRTTWYELSDGRRAVRHHSHAGRQLDDLPYTVVVPGGTEDGCAAPHFAARTLKEAVALAG